MTVLNIVKGKPPIDTIIVRCFHSEGGETEDVLIGFCSWDGTKLVSLDGDSYRLDDKVDKYEFHEDGSLTYWETLVSEEKWEKCLSVH